jgi:predicted ester cyclase
MPEPHPAGTLAWVKPPEEDAMTEDNKTLMKRFITDYQSNHDEAALYDVISSDLVDHSAAPGLPPGRHGVKVLHDAFFAAFDGFHAEVHDQIAEGDKVVTRKTLHGRNTGSWMGIPPTGRDVEIEVIDIVRVAGGQVVEHWNVVDQLGLMRQLGVIE